MAVGIVASQKPAPALTGSIARNPDGLQVNPPGERYARHILATLEDPDEVWLAFYPEAGQYRKRYLKVFRVEGGKGRLLSVVREGADGNTLVTSFKSSSWGSIEKQRQGALLYKKKEG